LEGILTVLVSRSMRAGCVAAITIALSTTAAVPAPAQDDSGLVVVIPNDKRYHQPGCPLVAKAGKSVQVMKLADAKKRGLEAHDCQAYADRGGKESAADANAVAVYVQPDDNHYHKLDCKKLKGNPTKITLDEAGKKYWPCPVCKPPIRQKG
jgi:hypothetical protein